VLRAHRGCNPHFPALRSGPTAGSGASPKIGKRGDLHPVVVIRRRPDFWTGRRDPGRSEGGDGLGVAGQGECTGIIGEVLEVGFYGDALSNPRMGTGTLAEHPTACEDRLCGVDTRHGMVRRAAPGPAGGAQGRAGRRGAKTTQCRFRGSPTHSPVGAKSRTVFSFD
jgi:hypothetical protein